MTDLPAFAFTCPGKFTQLFVNQGITDFYTAWAYLEELPYRRMSNPRDLSAVFTLQGGTFTARHALLAQVAQEQAVTDLSLVLCVYDFNRDCPIIGDVLRQYALPVLPEICGCLKYRQQLYSLEERSRSLRRDVISEIEIAPAQIGNFKRRYHRNYLENWLSLERIDRKWSVEQVWRIREECLRAVEQHWNSRRQPMAA